MNENILDLLFGSTPVPFSEEKELDSLITLSQLSSRARSPRHFVEVVRGFRIEEDEVQVSFNVTSLFTNVPVDRTVWVIHDRLQNDRTLSVRTTLSPDRVAELLEVVIVIHLLQP